MIEETTESKWGRFESSGRVSDYLEYKGIMTKTYSGVKGEREFDYGGGTDNIGAQHRRA